MPPIYNSVYAGERGEQYEQAAIKDKHFANTFFSIASYAWNKLPKKLRLITNMNVFKTDLSALLKQCKDKLYSFGSRVGNIYHTQLRVGRSQQIGHLFELVLLKTPGCLSGKSDSDSALMPTRIYSTFTEN